MSVTLHTVDEGIVQAINDAKFYEQLTNSVCGMVAGGVCTVVSANTIHITAGWGVIQGRLFTIDADDIDVAVSESGTVDGRLKLVIDISDTSNPIYIDSEAEASLDPLVQENLNAGGYVYEFALATYDVDETNVTNIVSNTQISIVPVNLSTLSTLALMQTADITAIEFVNSLPVSPDATTLYLIPEA